MTEPSDRQRAGGESGGEPGSLIGRTIGAYVVEAFIGSGAMGQVYRGRDRTLGRPVAIKTLPAALATDPDLLSRSAREARMLAAVNHPNIATVHGIETWDDQRGLVMELVDGVTLAERLSEARSTPGTAGLPIAEVLRIGRQLADGLQAAHARGVIHRDLKPANVKLRPDGVVKILDFGLAKAVDASTAGEASLATSTGTRIGTILGTPAYMSPEQARGLTLDGRSDVFSLGVVLHEMLTGTAPFKGATTVETLARVLETRPADVRRLRADIPEALARLVERCLEKDRNARPSAADTHAALVAIDVPRPAAWHTGASRTRVLVGAFAIGLVAASAMGAWWFVTREARAARQRVPELMQLAERFDYDGFYRAARDVVPLLPDDLQIKQVWLNLTFPINRIDSDPAGADVFVKGYAAIDAEWIPVGRTPIADIRVPFSALRVRIAKDGYAAVEGTMNGPSTTYVLDKVDAVPEGMVRVRGSAASIGTRSMPVSDFWMDRFEVTNAQFKTFVDAGGYRTPEYWTEPIVEDGRRLEWADAMKRFLDRTGRQGPSTWAVGTYPNGQADGPVAGVSWYEAMAYAAFAGKSLPTVYQWRSAVSSFGGVGGIFSDILTLSNFEANGPSPVGRHAGIGPHGTFDMAGNVKEWCWNASAGGRMILGGGWNESSYKYLDLDAQPGLQRGPAMGLRLVKNIDAPSAASLEPIQQQLRDYSKETPVDDAAFALVRSLYRYDPRALNATIEASQDTPNWRRETVTLDAAYDAERVIVHVYLPRSSSPPYQPIVYFPGGDAPNLPSSRDLRLNTVDFVMRTGRALLFPVYKGTYERRSAVTGPSGMRDRAIASVRDFGRVLELIDSRSDLDRERIGFYGDSRGAYYGVLITALFPRVRASVLVGAGLSTVAAPTEIDTINFAPRVRVPTLMIAGRTDFLQPVESAQRPLFRLLGVPAADKRHAVLEGGHALASIPEATREILDWFDRYLGPVTPAPRP